MIRRNVAPIQILWTRLKKKIGLKEPEAQITITFVKFVKSVSTNILLSGKQTAKKYLFYIVYQFHEIFVKKNKINKLQ